MRCYFTRRSSIQGVTFIKAASDVELIEKAKQLFQETGKSFDGFEVWHGDRFVYRFQRDSLSPQQKASGGR
jgi:hypothetical protein